MPAPVTDSRSNADEQIAHAASVIGRSEHRRRVFEAVYRGRRRTKTVDEIAVAVDLPRKRVLEEGRKLAAQHIVDQCKVGGVTAYTKDDFYAANRDRIIRLVSDPSKLAAFPTKRNPTAARVATQVIRVPAVAVDVQALTVDDIDSFAAVRSVSARKVITAATASMDESALKNGICSIIGVPSTQRDWGGEQNDLFTTRVRLRGKRVAATFAFKGRGTRGKLTPAKMGKNGDQVQRLFRTPARLFVVHYVGEIDQGIHDLMRELAKARSVAEGQVLYCAIDGRDTDRLVAAYPDAFRGAART